MITTSHEDLQGQINSLNQQVMELKNGLFQITEYLTKISTQVNDLHSKPQSVIEQLVLPQPIHKEEKKQDSETWIEEEGVPQGYFFIRNDFPTPNVFYLDRMGNEKKVQDYRGYVYLGGDKSEGIPGKKFDLVDLRKKYF